MIIGEIGRIMTSWVAVGEVVCGVHDLHLLRNGQCGMSFHRGTSAARACTVWRNWQKWAKKKINAKNLYDEVRHFMFVSISSIDRFFIDFFFVFCTFSEKIPQTILFFME